MSEQGIKTMNWIVDDGATIEYCATWEDVRVAVLTSQRNGRVSETFYNHKDFGWVPMDFEV